MKARVALWILACAIASAIIVYSLLLNIPSHDVLLYLQCQNIETGRLQVTLIDENNEPFYEQDYQLDTACNQAGLRIFKGARTSWLDVDLQLHSADGTHLITTKGSREQNNILLDENGFHVALELTGEPPSIAFHRL